jgi:hypothetical protein
MSSNAQRNRELMPNVAAMLDEFRAQCDIPFKVIWASDQQTGHEVGSRSDNEAAYQIPHNIYQPESTKGKRK